MAIDNGYADPFSDYWLADEGHYGSSSSSSSGGKSSGSSSSNSSSSSSSSNSSYSDPGSDYWLADQGHYSSGGSNLSDSGGAYYSDPGSDYWLADQGHYGTSGSNLSDGGGGGYSLGGSSSGGSNLGGDGGGYTGPSNLGSDGSGIMAAARATDFDSLWGTSPGGSADLGRMLGIAAAERALATLATQRPNGEPKEESREEQLRSVNFDDLWGSLPMPGTPFIDFQTIWDGLYARPEAAPGMTASGRATAGGSDPMQALLSGSAVLTRPNQPAGSVVDAKIAERLAPSQPGLPLTDPGALQTRTVPTVQVDPKTGNLLLSIGPPDPGPKLITPAPGVQRPTSPFPIQSAPALSPTQGPTPSVSPVPVIPSVTQGVAKPTDIVAVNPHTNEPMTLAELQQYMDGRFAGTSADPKRGTAEPPAGAVLGTDGYYYRPDGAGGYDIVGRVEGYSPSELYTAANAGAFLDPSNIGVPEQPAPRPGVDNPVWNKIVAGAGGILGNTVLGGIVKTMFPDFWENTGQAAAGLDTAPRTASMGMGQPGEYPTTSLSTDDGSAYFGSSGDPDQDDEDEEDPNGGQTPGDSLYDRFGDVVFPDLPPYRPGVDPEWLYFRRREELRDGGIVRGYADGGVVQPLAGQDPRVQLMAEAELALSGAHPDPEPVLAEFVKVFGPEMLEQLRAKVGKRGARMVRGPGGPRDDAVPARINGVEEARLSDGEFVMTADAVRNAGDGDPMAGAARLMQLNEVLSGRGSPEAAVEVEAVM